MKTHFDWLSDYAAADSCYPNHAPRPLAGITGNFGDRGCELAEGYFRSVEAAGGVPVVLPPTDDVATLLSCLDRVDGVLFSGGGDLNPLYFGDDPHPALHGVNGRRDWGGVDVGPSGLRPSVTHAGYMPWHSGYGGCYGRRSLPGYCRMA